MTQSPQTAILSKSVKILSDKQEETLKNKAGIDFYLTIVSHHESVQSAIFCHTCYNSISKMKIPRLHVSNGLQTDPIPEELQLTELEQQLIALVQIFMKVKKLPKHMMNAVVDTVINVPMEIEDIEKTVTSLPRLPDDAELLVVKLKRKMEYNNNHIEQYISTKKLFEALKTLKKLGNKYYQFVTPPVTISLNDTVCA